MAQLAIKGHSTRGKEVIEILEMLGGKNVTNYDGRNTKSFYFINNIIICSSYGSGKLLGIDCYTLEQFLEKFPYKVGDKAFAFGNKCTIIDEVWDESIDEVVYTIKLDTSKYTTTKLSNQLQPYKEETMDKANKAVFDANAQCCDITNHLIKEETMEEQIVTEDITLEKAVMCTFREMVEGKQRLRIAMNEGFELKEENGNFFVYKKKGEYPKTYEECCEVLFPNSIELGKVLTSGYNCELLKKLGELLICRDAYWKIVGEQIGLDKPWEPDWTNDEWPDMAYICYDGKSINKDYGFPCCNMILIFPTEEMRDAFYENFKDLIKKCKDLL